MNELRQRGLFNENGDAEVSKRRMINGNTTNLNDFNNIKYEWTSSWYRQAMNNFWIPEEINLSQDIKDYNNLEEDERKAFDKTLSFLVFLDSLQSANLPNVGAYITANEVNLCLSIQTFQEEIHSQSYGYILDTVCFPEKRNQILYQWRDDERLLQRNKFIGDLYNEFLNERTRLSLVKTMIANYILEGIYFYSGFMFFYSLGRIGKMPGTVQEIRYINRDENTHLWLFRSIILELKKEESDMFSQEYVQIYKYMIKQGAEEEISWGKYVYGNRIKGLTENMIESYVKYLANLRSKGLGLGIIYEGYETEPVSMRWISKYSDPNMLKTDFFEGKPSAYAKSSTLKDDL